jgi:hypothetical protein
VNARKKALRMLLLVALVLAATTIACDSTGGDGDVIHVPDNYGGGLGDLLGIADFFEDVTQAPFGE